MGRIGGGERMRVVALTLMMLCPAAAFADAHPAAPKPDISYTLELVRQPFPYVLVTLVTPGDPKGVTQVSLSDWGGIEHSENEVHGLTATDDKGNSLPIEREAPKGPSVHGPVWTVRHSPGATLHLRYALVSTQYDVGSGSDSYYRPIIRSDLFHIIGTTALLKVRGGLDEKKLRIALHWRGFREAGWKVACSFGVGEDDLVTEQVWDEFREAVFIAGDIRLVRRDIDPPPKARGSAASHGAPLWIAVAGHDWGFTDDAFADLTAAVIRSQRSFFADWTWPVFVVTVIPVGVASAHSYSQGGTGLTNSFALFLSPNTGLAPREGNGTSMAWLLAHELFHEWNGRRYELADPEALGYWFSEGFTNFYARRLLFRFGLSDVKDYLANLNREISDYDQSPVRTEPATRIAEDFWKGEAIQKLPYQRGDLVAAAVDAEIRRVSKGTKSLDDMMKEMLAARRDPAPTWSSDDILHTIEGYTSKAFAERIRQVVVTGAMLELDPHLLDPCLRGSADPVATYDLGFDQEAALSRHVITHLEVGSAAEHAGLREGQRLVHWSMRKGDAQFPVECEVDLGEGKTQKLKFLPQGKPVSIVQFHADGPLPKECLTRL